MGASESIILPANRPAAAQPGVGAGGDDTSSPAGQTRALVPLASPAVQAAPAARPCARFLAQLIATAQRAPQTRARRRAEPDHATTVYGAAASVRRDGSTFHRSM